MVAAAECGCAKGLTITHKKHGGTVLRGKLISTYQGHFRYNAKRTGQRTVDGVPPKTSVQSGMQVPKWECSEAPVALAGSPLNQLMQEQSSIEKVISYLESMLVGYYVSLNADSFIIIMCRIYVVCWNLPAYTKGPPIRCTSAQLTSQHATTEDANGDGTIDLDEMIQYLATRT